MIMGIIGSLIGAAGNLIGSGMNYKSQKEANEANLRMNAETNAMNYKIAQETNKSNMDIAQMNNEYNRAMFDKQIAYNWESWNAQNEYNTTSNQLKRWTDAGLPAWAFNGNSGEAQALGGINPPSAQGATMQAPTMQAGHVEAPQFSFDFMANLMNAFQIQSMQQDTRIKSATADIAEYDADIRSARNQLELIKLQREADNIFEDTYGKRENREKVMLEKQYQQMMNDTFMTNFRSVLAQRDSQTRAALATSAFTDVQRSIAALRLESLPQQIKFELADMQAGISLKYRQGELTRRQAVSETYKQTESMLRAAGIRVDNRVKRRTADALIRESIARANKAEFNQYYDNPLQWVQGEYGILSDYAKQHMRGDYLRGFIPFVSSLSR